MKFKAIIFDFDGVLFDSEKIHLQAGNKVFQEFGFTIPHDEYFLNYVGLSDNEMFDVVLKKKAIQLSADKVSSLRQSKINAYKEIIEGYGGFLAGVPHVKSFIETHVKLINHMAICTNATREEIEATLKGLEGGMLKRYFKHIVTIDDVDQGKPSPEGYILAASHLTVTPAECLVIEDTQKGINAAKEAGMTVIAITTTHDKMTLKNADFIADNYHEIDRWIKSV